MRERMGSALRIGCLAVVVAFVGVGSTVAQERGFSATPLAADGQFQSTTPKAGTVGTLRATRGRLTPAAAPRISVIVKLEDESVASYTGGVSGLAATSPAVTGRARLDVGSAATQRYREHLKAKRDAFEAAARQAIPAASVVHRFDLILGGVSMVVPADQVSTLRQLPGVAAVYPDALLQLHTERSPAFIGAPTVWAALGGPGSAGAGIIVGVLDSGVWPEHPSFADPDPLGASYPAPPPPTAGTRACEFTGGSNPGPAFACNNKLIGADRFMATYEAQVGLLPTEFTTARDDDGHGTHTASTAAGNRGVAASIFGLPRGTISGTAPRAHVMAYKVCGDDGCFGSDSVAAIQKAIQDGVNVINFSISGGSDPYGDAVELAFLDAYAAGVFVAASAGNSGPGPDTVEHRGPWVTTVGASTTDRSFLSQLTVAAGNGDTVALVGASISGGLGTPAPVVLASTLGDAGCVNPFAPGSVTGKVVACERPGARIAKSFNVAQGGAVGMLLYDLTTPGTPQGIFADSHWVPTVHLASAEGAALLSFIGTHSGVTATFTMGVASPGQGDRMASFSSRGGPGQVLGVSKPDVTGPGVQILAGQTPMPATSAGGPSGELFQAIQGTSMSSPHVAGAAALLKDLHPDWTPGQIKSALMTTAKVQGLVKEDGVTPFTPFDAGSGRIDLARAGDPGITFDVTDAEYLALATHLWDANYPSVYVPAVPGVTTVRRTARSVVPYPLSWSIRVASSPPDVTITTSNYVVLPAGAQKGFDITIDARAVPLGEVRHARIELVSGVRVARMPITIIRQQASVLLEKTCAPTTFPRGDATTCTVTMTNPTFEDAAVSMTISFPRELRLEPASVTGGATAFRNRVLFSGTLGARQPPDVAIGPGSSPAGYLPLSGFGVDPFSGVGDETIIDVNVPPFLYGGDVYTRIAITSNGYAVVGGGTSADLAFVNQNFPDAAPPNNVLAPFWTDLDPSAGGALRAGVLTDGTNSWIVLDWEAVKEFSTARVNSFQIWIGVDGAEEISYTYGTLQGNGDGGFLTVGAENLNGSRGASVYVDGTGTLPTSATELRVTTTPGAPGETRVITYKATGVHAGTWTTCAEMTGDIFPGISTACASGEVTR